jgi:hypothetical protein
LVHSYLILLASVVIRLTPTVKRTCLKLCLSGLEYLFVRSISVLIWQLHSAFIIFTFSNYYLHIQQLLSSHSAFIIFTFSIYYLHIQQLLSSHSAIIILTFSIYYLHIQQLVSSHSAFIIFTFINYYLHIQHLLSSHSSIIIYSFSGSKRYTNILFYIILYIILIHCTRVMDSYSVYSWKIIAECEDNNCWMWR